MNPSLGAVAPRYVLIVRPFFLSAPLFFLCFSSGFFFFFFIDANGLVAVAFVKTAVHNSHAFYSHAHVRGKGGGWLY